MSGFTGLYDRRGDDVSWTRWSGSQFDERFTQDLSGLGKMDLFVFVVPFSSGDSETAGFGPKNFMITEKKTGVKKMRIK
jgi:hypothetical protein